MTTPLPEPVIKPADQVYDGHEAYYTSDQMRAYGAAEYRRAIEFAVSRCMYYSARNDDMGAIIAQNILLRATP